MTTAVEMKSIKELTNEYKEMMSCGILMAGGTKTHWALCEKYGCDPYELWGHTDTDEKMLLWCVEYGMISDADAKEQITRIEC